MMASSDIILLLALPAQGIEKIREDWRQHSPTPKPMNVDLKLPSARLPISWRQSSRASLTAELCGDYAGLLEFVSGKSK
jgi:hypothetical protein